MTDTSTTQPLSAPTDSYRYQPESASAEANGHGRHRGPVTDRTGRVPPTGDIAARPAGPATRLSDQNGEGAGYVPRARTPPLHHSIPSRDICTAGCHTRVPQESVRTPLPRRRPASTVVDMTQTRSARCGQRRSFPTLERRPADRPDAVKREKPRDTDMTWWARVLRRRSARCARGADHAGPPPTGFALLPWLLMGLGSFSNLLQGEAETRGSAAWACSPSTPSTSTSRSAPSTGRSASPSPPGWHWLTWRLVTTGLAVGYGGNWLLFFPLLGLATGAAPCAAGTWAGSGCCSRRRDGRGPARGRLEAPNIGYATFLSCMVTAAILSLSEAVRELRAAREELARRAVEKERLRFSRDLHDLLGHTMSVIVVKSEAARRLAAARPGRGAGADRGHRVGRAGRR